MFKVISRSLFILALVALLGAGLYFLVQKTSVGTPFGGRDFGAAAFQAPPAAAAGSVSSSSLSTPQNFRQFRPDGDRGGEGRNSFSLTRGLSGAIGNLLLIAGITTAVFLVRKYLFRRPAQLRIAGAS